MKQKLFEWQPWAVSELKSETSPDGKRVYQTPSGEMYPSVTTILSARSDKSALFEWRKRVGEQKANKITTQAARRGTNVHAIAEKYMQGRANFLEGQNPLAVSLFSDIKPIIDEHITKVYGNEMPLYSDILQTAGRCDLFCQFQGMNGVVDFKTSTKPKREEWIQNYFLQCTTYAMMIEERYQCAVPQIAVVIAVENDLPQLFVKRTSEFRDEVIKAFVTERVG